MDLERAYVTLKKQLICQVILKSTEQVLLDKYLPLKMNYFSALG